MHEYDISTNERSDPSTTSVIESPGGIFFPNSLTKYNAKLKWTYCNRPKSCVVSPGVGYTLE